MGRQIGKYEIQSEVGRGAMGIVYEATDLTIGRTVAVKVLQLNTVDADSLDELRARFRREAQAAGRLNHPNIVSVYDYGDDPGEPGAAGQDNGFAYIAMEFVRGEDLRAQLRAGKRFKIEEAHKLISQLLSALHHAHELGVIHRDIKPANLIVDSSGTLKLADFGIAQLAGSDLTQTGAMIGTPNYMSPEQLTGTSVDRRSDLYASGVVLYELLTGEPPFVGSAISIIQKILNQTPVVPSSLNPTLPAALDRVVQRGLARRVGDRFNTAEEFSKAIDAALTTSDPEPAQRSGIVRPPVQPDFKPKGSAGPGLAGIAAICGVAAVGAWAALTYWPERFGGGSSPIAGAKAAAASGTRAMSATVAAVAASVGIGPLFQSKAEIEQLAWTATQKADTAAAYRLYLKEYPDGAFSKLARILAETRGAEAAPKAATLAGSATLPRGPSTITSTSAILAGAAPTATATGRATSLRDALAECETKARAGDVSCQLRLGVAYRNADAANRDYAKALTWFQSAATRGSARAMSQVGAIYQEGLGVPQDFTEALRWYRRAADQGDATAENQVALAYQEGHTVLANAVLAADWFRKAADQGYAPAQAALGKLYLTGDGVFKDTGKARTLLEAAAAQGNADAAASLASAR